MCTCARFMHFKHIYFVFTENKWNRGYRKICSCIRGLYICISSLFHRFSFNSKHLYNSKHTKKHTEKTENIFSMNEQLTWNYFKIYKFNNWLSTKSIFWIFSSYFHQIPNLFRMTTKRMKEKKKNHTKPFRRCVRILFVFVLICSECVWNL